MSELFLIKIIDESYSTRRACDLLSVRHPWAFVHFCAIKWLLFEARVRKKERNSTNLTRGVSSESFAGLVLRIAACAIWGFGQCESAGGARHTDRNNERKGYGHQEETHLCE